MKSGKITYYIFLLIWCISSSYLLYKYSLNAGYWSTPFLFSFVTYIAIIIINKGFNKLIAMMTLFYIGFGCWFVWDMITMFMSILSGEWS